MSCFVAAAVIGCTVAEVAVVMTAISVGMTVVGAVTGSKDLMKAGAIVGLVSGAGSLVSSGINAAATAAAAEEGAQMAANSAGSVAAANEAVNAAGNGIVQTSAAPVLADATGAGANSLVGSANAAANTGLTSASQDPLASFNWNATTPAPATTDYGLAAEAGYTTPAAPTAAAPAPAQVAAPAPAPVAQPATNAATASADKNLNAMSDTMSQVNAGTKVLTPAEDAGWLAKIGDAWKGLDSMGKMAVMKIAGDGLAGLQTAKLKAQELAQNQQRINQTSYGSQPIAGNGMIAQRMGY